MRSSIGKDLKELRWAVTINKAKKTGEIPNLKPKQQAYMIRSLIMEGRRDLGTKLFEELKKEERDPVLWTCRMRACSSVGDALDQLNRSIGDGCYPDNKTCEALLEVVSIYGNSSDVLSVIESVKRGGLQLSECNYTTALKISRDNPKLFLQIWKEMITFGKFSPPSAVTLCNLTYYLVKNNIDADDLDELNSLSWNSFRDSCLRVHPPILKSLLKRMAEVNNRTSKCPQRAAFIEQGLVVKHNMDDIDEHFKTMKQITNWENLEQRKTFTSWMYRWCLHLYGKCDAGGVEIFDTLLSNMCLLQCDSIIKPIEAAERFLRDAVRSIENSTCSKPSSSPMSSRSGDSTVSCGSTSLTDSIPTFEKILCYQKLHLLVGGEFIGIYFILTEGRIIIKLGGGIEHIIPILLVDSFKHNREFRGQSCTIISIFFKNSTVIHLRAPIPQTPFIIKVLRGYLPMNYPKSAFFAFKYSLNAKYWIPEITSKDVLKREFERILSQCASAKLRVTAANKNFKVSGTMPEMSLVAAALSDDEISELARFRVFGRFPMVSWMHPGTKACLIRASQPLVGLRMKRCSIDEQYVKELSVGDDYPVAIVDARPSTAACGNLAKGGGYINPKHYNKCRQVHAEIGNIHTMTKSLRMLREILSNSHNEDLWLPKLFKTGWMQHIQRLLQISVHIVKMIDKESTSTLVHCTNGWDRTSQIVSLANLMLDPYYRTVAGFAVLIEKDWCSGAHKFAERTGTLGKDEHRPKGVSPIFLQFLECVLQVMKQFPNSFEFTEDFLLFVANSPWDHRIGSFLVNTPKARASVESKTISLYEYVSYIMSNHEERSENKSTCSSLCSELNDDIELSTSCVTAVIAVLRIVGIPVCKKSDFDMNAESFINKQYNRYPRTSKDRVLYPSTQARDLVLWTRQHCPLDHKIRTMKLSSSCRATALVLQSSSVQQCWFPDPLTSTCFSCSIPFSFRMRKHHCRRCGYLYCSKCCPKNQKNDYGRVCISCYHMNVHGYNAVEHSNSAWDTIGASEPLLLFGQ